MYHVAHTGAHPVPLDFNTLRDTDSLADAPGPDLRPHDAPPAPDLDTGALLAELGLPAQAVREIVASLSDPGS